MTGYILYLELSKVTSNSEEIFSLPLLPLFVFFLSWLPKVQTALKVNKTPLVSHWEHMSGEKHREVCVLRDFFFCLVCLFNMERWWGVHSCHITFIIAWSSFFNSISTKYRHTAKVFWSELFFSLFFCRPFWHRRFSLQAFHLNKCVCN